MDAIRRVQSISATILTMRSRRNARMFLFWAYFHAAVARGRCAERPCAILARWPFCTVLRNWTHGWTMISSRAELSISLPRGDHSAAQTVAMRLSAFRQRALTTCVIIFLLQPQVILPVWSRAQQAASQESSPYGAARVDRNVVYGMYSGLALLMDVYHPQKPNGYGAILILGSAWASPLDYGARQLKNSFQELSPFVEPLMKAGYTVFAINHRATPRFHSPAQIEDAH